MRIKSGCRFTTLLLVFALLFTSLGCAYADTVDAPKHIVDVPADYEYGRSVSYFADVPSDYEYAEDVAFLANAGVIQGSDDGKYEPERTLTVSEFAVLVKRIYGDAFYNDHTNNYVLREWPLDESVAGAPDTPVTLSYFLKYVFRNEGIVLYPYNVKGAQTNDGVDEDADDGYTYTAKLIGLCGADAISTDEISRGEAAHILRCVLTETYEGAKPALISYVNFSFESEFESQAKQAIRYISNIPKPILDEFNRTGWSVVLGDDYINEWSRGKGRIAGGLTVFGDKIIYVGSNGLPYQIIYHEFGHFLYWSLCSLPFIDTQEQLYTAEKATAQWFISEYSASSSSEFFAETFAYWMNAKTSGASESTKLASMEQYMPRTYAFFSSLEADGWTQ